MELLFVILTFTSIFAIYDALRRINNNILNHTKEIKELRAELTQNRKK